MYLYGLHSKKRKKLFKKTKDKLHTRVPPFYGLIILFNATSINLYMYLYALHSKKRKKLFNKTKDKRQKTNYIHEYPLFIGL